MPSSRAIASVVKEIEEVLPPMVFFAVGFNLVELTTQLVLDDHLARFANYLVATAEALLWDRRCWGRTGRAPRRTASLAWLLIVDEV